MVLEEVLLLLDEELLDEELLDDDDLCLLCTLLDKMYSSASTITL